METLINDLLRYAVYYVEAFLKRPLWAILPGIAALAAGIAVIYYTPKTYESEALVMIEAQSRSGLVPTTIAGEHLRFLEQRILARERLLELAEKFDLFPGLRQTLPGTTLAQILSSHVSIQTVATEASDRYAGTSAVRIRFSYGSAEPTAAVVSELINMITDENRRLRVQRASEMSQFLAREVEEMTQRLEAKRAEWRDYFEINSDALPGRIESHQTELQDKDRELAELDQSIVSLDQELRLLEAELRLGPRRSEGVVNDRTQLAELETELAAKSATYSDIHPEIRALTLKIEGLKQKIAADTLAQATVVPELSPEQALIAERISIAKARHQSLMKKRAETFSRISWLRETAGRAPAVAVQLEAIERERQSLQSGLDDMKSRLATARIGERLELDESSEHVQVIEAPETPRYASAPNRKKMLAMALAAACACGLGGLLLGDTLQRSIRGTFDLKDVLAGSTVVVIPLWSAKWQRKSERDRPDDRFTDFIGPEGRVAT
jgi:uncharacterized protein involved in exopolysaccharide biosynthesis